MTSTMMINMIKEGNTNANTGQLTVGDELIGGDELTGGTSNLYV